MMRCLFFSSATLSSIRYVRISIFGPIPYSGSMPHLWFYCRRSSGVATTFSQKYLRQRAKRTMCFGYFVFVHMKNDLERCQQPSYYNHRVCVAIRYIYHAPQIRRETAFGFVWSWPSWRAAAPTLCAARGWTSSPASWRFYRGVITLLERTDYFVIQGGMLGVCWIGETSW